ncbi:hypothetical protein [Pseudomonas panipatensis]|uniref:hypothetical protein n=1 Tax=Pseudomonas panipatensis TaxID=428992 RepID=UPI0035AFD5D8
MDRNKKIYYFVQCAADSNVGLIGLACLLASCMLLASGFFLFKNTAYFDDSFIYLHMAANIVEQGTARYFPIVDSSLLLSSSPLRLLTLVPGFFVLDIFNIPLRTIESARFAFLCSGFVAFLCFVPFWKNRLQLYLFTGAVFFLMGTSLDSIFLMEGGVLFFSLFTLVKLLTERSENYFVIGIAIILVGLSRPEIGAISVVSVLLMCMNDRRAIVQLVLGILFAFSIYWALMLALGVYPIPSTIWSKQITGKLKLFSDKNLIEVLPLSIAHIMGFSWPWVGWGFIALPAVFSLSLARGAVPILSAVVLLLIVAISMPGNFVWYSENFLIALFALSVVVVVESYRRGMVKVASMLGVVILVAFLLTLHENFGKNKIYPWNENSPGYLAYKEVGSGSIDNGRFIIRRYSNEPVRLRMCEIGLVSYFSGPNAWIYDVCGLVQIGNLKGASQSWLRYIYPSSFVETGDDQLMRFKDNNTTPVIDVWALRNKEEALGAVGKCKFVDEIFCINEYKR